MKILFLGRGGNHPATRYRITQYLDYLKQNGIEYALEFFPAGFFGWLRLVRLAGNYNAVFIQKKRIGNFWLWLFRRRGCKIIYDIDDAVMFNSSRHSSPDSPGRMKRFVKMVRASDFVIAGNKYLRSLVEPHNKNCAVMPTTIDMKKYPAKDYESTGTGACTIGWIGGGKSIVFLNEIMPVLEDLAGRFDIRLKIVCNTFTESGRLEIIKKQWKEEEEAADILTFDIGLSPLPDDPWSKGKCATKLLQCMAAGIPTVSSNAGVHPDMIKDGVNGYMAGSPQEWMEKISILINDSIKRREIGLSGRKTVLDLYSVEANAPGLLKILS
ncbi:MAG: glycosyltransferase family 4 protein [Planctomycetes bacterium]|nr:glycosyltransferase family 4 protein [Planctomycetota bacterium]